MLYKRWQLINPLYSHSGINAAQRVVNINLGKTNTIFNESEYLAHWIYRNLGQKWLPVSVQTAI